MGKAAAANVTPTSEHDKNTATVDVTPAYEDGKTTQLTVDDTPVNENNKKTQQLKFIQT